MAINNIDDINFKLNLIHDFLDYNITLKRPSKVGGKAYGIPKKTLAWPKIRSTTLCHGLYDGSGLSYKYTCKYKYNNKNPIIIVNLKKNVLP